MFRNKVKAQRGKKLTEEQADAMIRAAQRIIEAIEAEGVDGAAKLVKAPPAHFTLFQNHPNPFNPVTTITYGLAQAGEVELAIYTIAGQRVANLVAGYQNEGFYEVSWDGSGFANGIFLYQLRAGRYTETRRMILLK